ncbi:hypothetical protein BofuT4_P086400.1 [Botrytis cinerea T4]|uniref:Uncharacterized protein n=1 Tax=Botryotinia fuckeliana (strain T4) TaxID=999810 RepID=G2YGG3_BOTF4|nr:hypothetical protein BofuT4_P086400.1 [Botrytis cinerea T4]
MSSMNHDELMDRCMHGLAGVSMYIINGLISKSEISSSKLHENTNTNLLSLLK